MHTQAQRSTLTAMHTYPCAHRHSQRDTQGQLQKCPTARWAVIPLLISCGKDPHRKHTLAQEHTRMHTNLSPQAPAHSGVNARGQGNRARRGLAHRGIPPLQSTLHKSGQLQRIDGRGYPPTSGLPLQTVWRSRGPRLQGAISRSLEELSLSQLPDLRPTLTMERPSSWLHQGH